MRIVVVSAHYPPNFVSGGTLVPQRLARGLRDRGHDVSVYAGFLDAARPPLEAWDEVDETGLPTRWIVTTPWTAWSDRHNFDNPPVEADFARHLHDIRPDVVHLHSLQSLGAGLVRAAKTSGAQVVVTAHDFWWCCARQFLVDRDYQPCPLVVTAGSCPCEAGRDWLVDRNRWLSTELARADVVLAPSASAASVLAANGIDPERLRVDENGIPAHARDDGPGRALDDRRKDVLEFLYAGGGDEMKGVHVLFAAARRLAGQPGWHLTAYGAAPWVERTGFDLGDLPIDVCKAYAPEEQSHVLSAADVLVVPSVMRESHSLLTREAMLAGVPVIATDALGPEEVIDDGVNGIIVPAADDEALADAMQSVIVDRSIVPRWRAHCRTVEVRSLDDQLDGLEALFRELRSRDHAARHERRVRRVLFVCGIEGAPLRYRARLPAEAIGLYGIESDVRHFFDPDLPSLAERAQAMVLYRVPATTTILELAARVRARGVPVLFDADDLIFDPDVDDEIPALKILSAAQAEEWRHGILRYRTTMEACDGYIASTDTLAAHAALVTALPVERFDNGVGILMNRLAIAARRRPRTPGPPRVGYFSGTETHDHDWAMIEPAIIDLLDERPSLELWLGGLLPETPALARFRGRVHRWPMLPWRELPGVLRDLDVNLAPLELGSRFNEAKSAIKWMEAALVETPTVASPTQPFRTAIRDGVTGILAESHDDWRRGIAELLDDDHARRRIGRVAARDALLRWSPPLQGRRYADLLERAAARAAADPGRAARPGRDDWLPVVEHEQPRPKVLEPYRLGRDEGDRAIVEWQTVNAWRRLLTDRARSSVREDGVWTTARRTLRAVRRVATRRR